MGQMHTEETADMSKFARNSHLIEEMEYLGVKCKKRWAPSSVDRCRRWAPRLALFIGAGERGRAWDGWKLQTSF